MDTLLHRLLRPARRTRQRVTALVVVALVGWLGVSAGHLHLPGEATHADAQPTACEHADGHGHAHAHALGHTDAHAHGHTDAHALAADGAEVQHERLHHCAVCLSLERGAGPAAPPVLAVAFTPTAEHRSGAARLAPESAAPSSYRSRAPPVA